VYGKEQLASAIAEAAASSSSLRLCPNCHALTETWCRRQGSIPLAG